MIALYQLKSMIELFVPKYAIWSYYIGIGALVGLTYYIIYRLQSSGIYLVGASAVIYSYLGYLSVFVTNTRVRLFDTIVLSVIDFALLSVITSIILILGKQNVGGNLTHLFGFGYGFILATTIKVITRRKKQFKI